MKAKTYIFDLDLAPQDRWREILADYKPTLRLVENKIDELGIPSAALHLASIFSGYISHIEELRAIAAVSGMNLQKLILMQFVYEACAHCTSIIVPGQTPAHIRTMEWKMTFLKHITIQLEYRRSGRTIAYASTWVAYVGVFTGMRCNAYSISVNYRESNNSYFQNVYQVLKRSWPIGFLILDETLDFKGCQERLRNALLVSPVYFTLCGCAAEEGVIITRNRQSDERPQYLQRIAIYQTNMDHWLNDPIHDIFGSQERLDYLKEYFAKHKKVPVDFQMLYKQLWQLLSSEPIISEEVIYGTVMVPGLNFFETRVPVALNDGEQYTLNELSQRTIKKSNKPLKCKHCLQFFQEELNAKSLCVHRGTWHTSYWRNCHKVQCLMHGLSTAFRAHWSCCYITDKAQKVCVASSPHFALRI